MFIWNEPVGKSGLIGYDGYGKESYDASVC